MKFLRVTTSPTLIKGVAAVNELDDLKFEQFLHRIITKVANQSTEIFSLDEINKLCGIFDTSEETLQLAVKTLVHFYKKTAKYVFMPNNLKNNLIEIGFSFVKSETFVKLWAKEAKSILKNIAPDNDTIDLTWQLNAELSSVISKKSQVPKLHMTVTDNTKHEHEIEITHSELYSMFLQFESIQNELDNIM